MSYFSQRSSWASYALSLLRIVSGFTLLQHGLSHIFGFFSTAAHPAHAAAAFTLIWFAGVLELVGGALLVSGLFTRPVAFILSGELAVAYFLAHAPKAFWPNVNGGELAVLYSFLLLYLAFAGGGPLSLDRVLQKVHHGDAQAPEQGGGAARATVCSSCG